MNDPIKDKYLIDFLRTNLPKFPEGAPDLEQKIIAVIEKENWSELETKKLQKLTSKRQNRLWLVPPAIAASILVSWSGYRLMYPAKTNLVEEERLEAFLVNNWETIVGENQSEKQGDRELYWLNTTTTTDSQKSTSN